MAGTAAADGADAGDIQGMAFAVGVVPEHRPFGDGHRAGAVGPHLVSHRHGRIVDRVGLHQGVGRGDVLATVGVTIAVVQGEAQGPVAGIVRVVGIADALDQRLHRRQGSGAGEVDHQRAAIATGPGADGVAIETHALAALQADAIAAQDRQLVGRGGIAAE
ncbi:hypothetical protein D3C84_748470 [compost metagenome]